MQRSVTDIAKLIVILSIFTVVILSSWFAISERLDTYQEISGNIQINYPKWLYVLTLCVGMVSILVIPFIKNAIFRFFLSLVLALGFTANFIGNEILSEPLSFQLFQVFVNSVEEAGFAFAEYQSTFLTWIVIFLIIFFVCIKKPENKIPEVVASAWWLPFFAIAITGYAFRSSNYYLEEFASPIIMPSQIYYAATIPAKGNVPKDAIYSYDLINPGVEKIVIVVDESVRGDFLQINQSIFDNTPFLSANKHRYANYGISASYTNCSAKTRLAIRVGLLNSEIPIKREEIFKKSTFWQYAREAEYETVFIDGWQPLRSNHSWFGKFEEEFVDKRISAEINPFSTVDNRIAKLIKSELKKPGKQFIFVEKIGLHAPYDQNIPEGEPYIPGETSLPNLEILPEHKQKVIEYSQGIKNRVDDFFKTLIENEEFKNTLLIYTSDHGQSMFQAPYIATHCTKKENTHWGEGAVPLLVFSDNQQILEQYNIASQRSFNMTHQEALFPTLLGAMGFNKQQVSENYGLDLIERRFTQQPYFINGSINNKRHRRITIPADASPIGLSYEID